MLLTLPSWVSGRGREDSRSRFVEKPSVYGFLGEFAVEEVCFSLGLAGNERQPFGRVIFRPFNRSSIQVDYSSSCGWCRESIVCFAFNNNMHTRNQKGLW